MKRSRGSFWRRVLLKNKYVLLFGVVSAVLVAGLWPVRAGETLKIQFLVAYFGVVLVYWAINRLPSRIAGPYSWNYLLPDRIREIAELICTCRRSFVAVSGVFNEEVWGSPDVQLALSRVPQDANVRIYYTGKEIESASFRAWAQGRQASIEHLNQDIAHRIVIDELNVRVEFAEHGHIELLGKGRPAMFMYGEPEIAHEAMKGLEEALAQSTRAAA